MADKQAEQVSERQRIQGRPEQAQPPTSQPRREPERGIARREQSSTLAGRREGAFGPRSSPFGMMRRMMEDMDRLFEDFGFGALARAPARLGAPLIDVFTPALEVFEREGKLVVRADLPGVKAEDVRVNLDEGGLLIEGERKCEREETREGYYQTERSYGSFSRRIPLPSGIDAQSCDASFEDGVLEVLLDLPKESRRRIDMRSGKETKELPKERAEPGQNVRH